MCHGFLKSIDQNINGSFGRHTEHNPLNSFWFLLNVFTSYICILHLEVYLSYYDRFLNSHVTLSRLMRILSWNLVCKHQSIQFHLKILVPFPTTEVVSNSNCLLNYLTLHYLTNTFCMERKNPINLLKSNYGICFVVT